MRAEITQPSERSGTATERMTDVVWEYRRMARLREKLARLVEEWDVRLVVLKAVKPGCGSSTP